MNDKKFIDLVCGHFQCPPETYTETVFRECLYPHTAPFVKLLQWFDLNYFRPDYELIWSVANTTSLAELEHELDNERYYNPVTGLCRRLFRLRLSGQRLGRLATRLFA